MPDTNVYGVDPFLLQNAVLSDPTTRATATSFGAGSVRDFAFQKGQSLDDRWTVDGVVPGVTLEPNDGFLRFQAVAGAPAQWVHAAIKMPFSINKAATTAAFRLRVNSSDSPSVQFELLGGVTLGVQQSGSLSEYFFAGTGVFATSNIKPDGQWHTIVINASQGMIAIWEDDALLFQGAHDAWVDSVRANFGLLYSGGGGTSSVDLGDIKFLVGTTQQVRADPSKNKFAADQVRNVLLPVMADLKPLLGALNTAFAPIAAMLSSFTIRPWHMLWGVDPTAQMKTALRTFSQDPAVGRIVSRINTIRGSHAVAPQVLYIGAGVSLTLVVQGGYSLGFAIELENGGVNQSLFTMSYNVGLATNISAAGTVDFSLTPGHAADGLGWGAYVALEGGEIFQGSIGWTGVIPWSGATSGPAFTLGLTLGWIPGDIAGGFNYTYKMAKI